MTYQPTHYNICITPTYKYEGLHNDDTIVLFRFIVLTLRKYLSINLHFDTRETKVIIETLSNAQIVITIIFKKLINYPKKFIN
jgi:hypothetical protein